MLRTRFVTDHGEVRGGAGVVVSWSGDRRFLLVPHSTFSPQLGFDHRLTWDQVAGAIHTVRGVSPIDGKLGASSTHPIPIPDADYAASGRADGDLAAFAVDTIGAVKVLPLRAARLDAGDLLTMVTPAMRPGAGRVPARVDLAAGGVFLISLDGLPPLGRLLGVPLVDGDGALAGILIGARTEGPHWQGIAIGVEVIRTRLGEALRPPTNTAACTAAAEELRGLGDKSRTAAKVPPDETTWLLRVRVPELGPRFERFRAPMARVVVPDGAGVVRLVPAGALGENGAELPLAAIRDGRLAQAAADPTWRSAAKRIAIAVGRDRPARLIADIAAAMPANVPLALVGRKPAAVLADDATRSLPGAAPWFLARLATFGRGDFAVPPLAELTPATGSCKPARAALKSLADGDPWSWAAATADAAVQCHCHGLDLATIETIARYYIALRQDSGWIDLPRTAVGADTAADASAADLMATLSAGRR